MRHNADTYSSRLYITGYVLSIMIFRFFLYKINDNSIEKNFHLKNCANRIVSFLFIY